MTAAQWLDRARIAGLTIEGTFDIETGHLSSFHVIAGPNGFSRDVWEPLCLPLALVGVADLIDEVARRASRR